MNYNRQEELRQIDKIALDGIERSSGIIELLNFFKELGEKLKHLGYAISINSSKQHKVNLKSILHSALHVFTESSKKANPNVFIEENYPEEEVFVYASEEDLVRVL